LLISRDLFFCFSFLFFSRSIPFFFASILALGAATPAPTSVSSTGASSTSRLTRWGSHESKVHRDGLLKELLVVRAVDGSSGFFQRCVLDKGVSLQEKSDQQIRFRVVALSFSLP
jgi:hypothetical protein